MDEETAARLKAYETAALAAAQAAIPPQVKLALALIGALLILAAGVAGYFYLQHDHAVLLSQDQLKQSAELSKALGISQAQGEIAKRLIAEAQNKPPAIHYITQAPTIEQAAAQVQKEIDAGTSPACAIPADKTIVTANTKDQKVDVYRISLDKAHWGVAGLVLAGGSDPIEVGAGPAYHNKNWSAAAGITTRSRAFITIERYF